jgi:hypothetical protein
MCSADLKKAESADIKQVKEYVNSPMGRYSSWFSGVFYAGTDEAFDYVAIKHEAKTVKMFKVKKGEVGVKQQMKTIADEKKWVDITQMFPPSQ